MMQLLEMIKAVSFVIPKFKSLFTNANPLVVEECVIGCSLPKRIVTEVPILPDLAIDCESVMVSEQHYSCCSSVCSYAGHCEVYLRLRNESEHQVSIRSFVIERSSLKPSAQGSMLFIPQGGETNAPIRLHYDLDSMKPFAQRYEKINGCLIPIGDENFFEFGSIDIEPGGIRNILISFSAQRNSWNCSLSVRYEFLRRTKIAELGPRAGFNIHPLASVPESQRYRRTYSSEPPWIALESDPMFSADVEW